MWIELTQVGGSKILVFMGSGGYVSVLPYQNETSLLSTCEDKNRYHVQESYDQILKMLKQ